MAFRLQHIPGIPVYKRRAVGTFESDALTYHLELYNRLGPIYSMRSGLRSMLVIGGLEANEFVYGNGDLWSYSERMKFCREAFDATCVLQLDGEEHRKKRRRMSLGLKHTDLLEHAPAMSQVLFEMVRALPGGYHADLRSISKHLTMNMTSHALLQRDMPPGMSDKIDQFSHQLVFSDLLGSLRHAWYLNPVYRRLHRELRAEINRMLDARAANPPAKKDILALMLEAHPADEPPVSRVEIVNDVLFLMEAGAETGSQLIVWALMFIYHNPDWLAELREELETWDPSAFQGMNEWPKLKATILEIERLRPPVPYFTMIPNRDCEHQGVRIPKGMPIFHVAAVPHFSPEIYEDPFSFKPQRFLDNAKYPNKAHGTFGGGKHFCSGQPLARIQMSLAIANIVTSYDVIFDPAPSFRSEIDVVIMPEKPVPVRFVPRSPAVG